MSTVDRTAIPDAFLVAILVAAIAFLLDFVSTRDAFRRPSRARIVTEVRYYALLVTVLATMLGNLLLVTRHPWLFGLTTVQQMLVLDLMVVAQAFGWANRQTQRISLVPFAAAAGLMVTLIAAMF